VIPLWHPEYVPTAVILTKASQGIGQGVVLDATLQAEAIAKCDADDGLHLRLPNDHQLWLIEKNPGTPLAVVIPFDQDFLMRAAGAVRFHRLLAERNAGSPPRAQRLTTQQRTRLIQMLRALDGRSSDATYREIASVIFGPSVTIEKGWKSHPVRGRTIRLVNDAITMVNRGYLKLLRGR
jgi:hypothetical protein